MDIGVCVELPQENTFAKTVVIRYILQVFHPDVRYADLMNHQVCADKHLVIPASLEFNIRVKLVDDVRLWIVPSVLVLLRHGHNLSCIE